MIHNYILTTRSFKSNGNFNYCGISEQELGTHKEQTKDSEAPTMGMDDVFFSLRLSPYLLGESAIQMEKILPRLVQTEFSAPKKTEEEEEDDE